MVTGPAVTTTLRLTVFSVAVAAASLSAEKHTNVVRLCTFITLPWGNHVKEGELSLLSFLKQFGSQ